MRVTSLWKFSHFRFSQISLLPRRRARMLTADEPAHRHGGVDSSSDVSARLGCEDLCATSITNPTTRREVLAGASAPGPAC